MVDIRYKRKCSLKGGGGDAHTCWINKCRIRQAKKYCTNVEVWLHEAPTSLRRVDIEVDVVQYPPHQRKVFNCGVHIVHTLSAVGSSWASSFTPNPVFFPNHPSFSQFQAPCKISAYFHPSPELIGTHFWLLSLSSASSSRRLLKLGAAAPALRSCW